MAKNREVQIKFGIDTKEFTDGINKINSHVKTLNAALKLNSTQLKASSGDVNLLRERQSLLSEKLNEIKDKVDLSSKKLEEAKKIYGEDSEEIQKYSRALLSAQQQEQAIQNELTQCNAELQRSEAALKQTETATQQLTGKITKEKSELENLKKQYIDVVLEEGKNSDKAKELSKSMQDLNKSLQEDKDKLADAEKEAKELAPALEETDKAAQGAANGGWSTFKGVLSDLASNAIQAAGSALKGFAQDVIKTGSDFNASMSQVSAVSGATGDDLQALRNKAQEMGATTKFTATESAEAMNYMAMAGWDSQQMISGLPGILNLAAASGEDLATTSDIVTDALTAFGMGADDAGHFADVMAAASSSANTNVSMMGESFKYAAPVAGALGMSAEDTSVALGLMANAGIKASQGGTALRTILTNLSSPTDTVAKAMNSLGISIDDGNGNVLSLRELMGDLRSAFGNTKTSTEEFNNTYEQLTANYENGILTEKQYNKKVEELMHTTFGAEGALKAEAAAAIAGKQGMSGLLAIVNASDEDFNKLTAAVDGATDAQTGYSAAADMAATMQDNLQGDIDLAGSALAKLKQHIYDDLDKPARELMQTVTGEVIPAATKAYDSLKSGIGWLKEHQVLVMGFAIVLGSLTAGIVAYNTVMGIKATMDAMEATSLWGLVSAQLASNAAFLASPITWVVAGVVALVATTVVLWNKCEGFRNFVTGMWEGIKEGFGAAKDFVVNGVTSLGEKFNSAKDKVGNAVEGMKSKFSDLKNGAKEKMSVVADYAKQYMTSVKDTYEEAGGGIQGAVAVTMKVTEDKFKAGYNVINTLTKGKLDELKNSAVEKFNAIKDGATSKLQVMRQNVKTNMSAVKNEFDSAGGGIKGAAAAAMKMAEIEFKNGFNLLNTLTKGKLGDVTTGAKEKLDGLKGKFTDAASKIKDIFNFKIPTPSIKMPKIEVTWKNEGSLAKAAKFLGMPGLPKFDIKWNAAGAIFRRPTIIGYANGSWQGVGERGDEAVLPIDTLEDWIGNKMMEFLGSVPQIDYDKLGQIVIDGVKSHESVITLNGREVGRMNREVSRL